MEIWLIRHGETFPAGADTYDKIKKTANPGLTEKGLRQAGALAERCANIRFDKIAASDLNRAVTTAKILAGSRGIPVETDECFREIDMGALYLKTWHDFPDYFNEWKKHEEDLPYPGGESGGDVWMRCRAPLEKIIQETPERTAVVCHGGTIRSIICGMLGIPQQKRFLFGDPIENCSISVIRVVNARAVLHTVNEHSHIRGICSL